MLNKFYSFFRRRPPKRARICDLEVGTYQCIEGDAVAIGAPLPSPFSGTPCATLAVVNRYPLARSKRGVTRWSREKHFVFCHQFYVRDESGLVRIERCKRTKVFAYKFPTAKVPAETRVSSLSAFRASVRREDDGVLSSFEAVIRATSFRDARWHEIVIAEGSRVRVEGLVRSSGEPLPITAAVGFRDAPTMLEIVAPRTRALRITRINRSQSQEE